VVEFMACGRGYGAPAAPGTVTALRQTIGTGNAYRAAKEAAVRAPPRP
jgi:hypothetical protein